MEFHTNFKKVLEKGLKMWYYIQVLKKRGVAQLVERVVWDHEVARSIRVTPTKKRSFKTSSLNFY